MLQCFEQPRSHIKQAACERALGERTLRPMWDDLEASGVLPDDITSRDAAELFDKKIQAPPRPLSLSCISLLYSFSLACFWATLPLETPPSCSTKRSRRRLALGASFLLLLNFITEFYKLLTFDP